MTDDLIEQLLNEDESSSLDFKRDQYEFEGAADEKKAELLKDILAFANAWRRAYAYILIGVEEIKGGRSLIVGVQSHLDDAKLQQLVNSKTQRPIEFSYRPYLFEGVQIGIITIPVQDRPLFLKRDFGGLRKDVVYVRRGSSTAEANPDEIAKMGAAAATAARADPVLDLQFAAIYKRRELGSQITVQSVVFEPLLNPEIFRPQPKSHPGGIRSLMELELTINPSYYDELIKYKAQRVFFYPVGFVLENRTGQVALGVQLKATSVVQEGVRLIDATELPVRPVRNPFDQIARDRIASEASIQGPNPNVARYGDHWEITVDFGKVLPRSKIWSTGMIFVGGNDSQSVEFNAKIYAENLSEPSCVPMLIQIKTIRRPMERNDVERVIAEE